MSVAGQLSSYLDDGDWSNTKREVLFIESLKMNMHKCFVFRDSIATYISYIGTVFKLPSELSCENEL